MMGVRSRSRGDGILDAMEAEVVSAYTSPTNQMSPGSVAGLIQSRSRPCGLASGTPPVAVPGKPLKPPPRRSTPRSAGLSSHLDCGKSFRQGKRHPVDRTVHTR
jgi:predicted transcriptional regulator